MNAPTAWPEGIVARYLTVGGATVDLTYLSAKGDLIADCAGCGWWGRRDTGGLVTDTPDVEAARIKEWMPAARAMAQAHAETCRAMPNPAVTA